MVHDTQSSLTAGKVRIGCAGWTIRAQHTPLFPRSGSHLERYAQRFTAVEINTSFCRPHRQSTYRGWAAAVPDSFAFAVKAPKTITHELRLANAGSHLDAFLEQVSGLGGKLGTLLFQLPPSFAFDEAPVRSFLRTLRERFEGSVAWEPRHRSWFAGSADQLLAEFRIARAAVDPAIVDAAASPGGWSGLAYFRLHGSPRVYHSEYGPARLDRFARQLLGAADDRSAAWCIFDNTASGAATIDAFALQALLDSKLSKPTARRRLAGSND